MGCRCCCWFDALHGVKVLSLLLLLLLWRLWYRGLLVKLAHQRLQVRGDGGRDKHMSATGFVVWLSHDQAVQGCCVYKVYAVQVRACIRWRVYVCCGV
jgi:hypothetical protein